MSIKPEIVSKYAILDELPQRSSAVRLPKSPCPPSSCYSKDDSRSQTAADDAPDKRDTSTTQARYCDDLGDDHDITNSSINTYKRIITNPEVNLIMAIFTERANVERINSSRPWSALESDFAALEIMIKKRSPDIDDDDAEEALDIVRRLFISTEDGSHEYEFQELYELLSRANMYMSKNEVEAALAFARRVAEHFRPFELRRNISRREGRQRERARMSSRPAETFNELGVPFPSSWDAEDRGRSNRRGSISRAASAVRDTIKEGIRRLSRSRGPLDSRPSSPPRRRGSGNRHHRRRPDSRRVGSDTRAGEILLPSGHY